MIFKSLYLKNFRVTVQRCLITSSRSQEGSFLISLNSYILEFKNFFSLYYGEIENR